MRKIKIGIDVGGTFTHAVAVDIIKNELIGKTCVPTTHTAREGVARGVINSMLKLINENAIRSNEVILIAHSTTQATNALLEGDVATVGLIGMGRGFEGKFAKKEFNQKIVLAPEKNLPLFYKYIDLDENIDEKKISSYIDELISLGAKVIVVSEVFGVDHPENEEKVVQLAFQKNVLATAASQISKLYGLRVRTRTAILNGSMIPRMLETANMTETAVRESGINAPLMIMRSDGGIMDISEMRRRPILTMLSGPAAGVAAALMYAKVTDGIFIEVGGTSTDISVIKNGKPQIKSAKIGGNRLFIRTLDVRTLGIAGGSMIRIKGKEIIDVGPRSAHISNVEYVAFSEITNENYLELELIQPKPGDPSDYLVIRDKKTNVIYTITPTEASAFLKLSTVVGHSEPNIHSIERVFRWLGNKFNQKPEEIAHKILKLAARKIEPVIKQLIKEYKLDLKMVEIVGGGGGAPAIVPYTAKYLNIPFRIAENTEVISSIGAALGIIKDSIEKNIINPTETDLRYLRQKVVESVLSMGAIPESVESTIEIDSKNKKVIATAFGSTEFRTKEIGIKELSEEEIIQICAKSMKVEKEKCQIVGRTNRYFVVKSEIIEKKIFKLIKETKQKVRVIDKEGTIRLQFNNAITLNCNKDEIKQIISQVIQSYTSFGDAGALVPDIFILYGGKIIDTSGLITEQQIISVAEMELNNNFIEGNIIIIVSEKK